MAKEVSLDKIRNIKTFFARSEDYFTALSKNFAFFANKKNVGIIARSFNG